jgi:hypothetical protein
MIPYSKAFIALITSMALFSACSLPGSVPTPSPTTPVTTSSLSPVTDVHLEVPKPNQVITSPLVIRGTAPGTWFFEGQLRASLVSNSGQVLAQSAPQAQGEWMTEDQVYFEGKLIFTVPAGMETAIVVIENDNPSGLPENQKKYEVPVILK